jgi:hypothetical protein
MVGLQSFYNLESGSRLGSEQQRTKLMVICRVEGNLTQHLPGRQAQYEFLVWMLVARCRSGEEAQRSRSRGERG